MSHIVLKVHSEDNVVVALADLEEGRQVRCDGVSYTPVEYIPAKHKFAVRDFEIGDEVVMYGVLVGRATQPIRRGGMIHTQNVKHAVRSYALDGEKRVWIPPDVSAFEARTFMGYRRSDGRVGTRNCWLVIPLVFCENRNIEIIKASMLEPLGYASPRDFVIDIQPLMKAYRQGVDKDILWQQNIIKEAAEIRKNRLFENVDGIRFLTHEGGCGGTRADSDTLCRLLASYIAHPNVAGATILSLGCQHAQYELLQSALSALPCNVDKPIYMVEQQESLSERSMIAEAVKHTFTGLTVANRTERTPCPLSDLSIGLECGGSDGFSGISANPTLGIVSDLIVALGGTAILSEFPELNGVEQELIGRCETKASAEKFTHLMDAYAQSAAAVGSGFENNPSPGNIKDGLITDAMKSAGAARKGGTSPIKDILDYTEVAEKKGLHLLCTPGNDVESTTGLAGAGANIILFTTGLGTPTGNPIAPVIKVSTNTDLYHRMRDILDFDTGKIISGQETIASLGVELLEYVIGVASGDIWTAAERLEQNDFIPWKRGVSL